MFTLVFCTKNMIFKFQESHANLQWQIACSLKFDET